MCFWDYSVQFSSVQSLSRVWLFATPWIAAHQTSLSITNSWSSPRLMSIESVMPSSHLILCCPLLLLPPIPPSIKVYYYFYLRLLLLLYSAYLPNKISGFSLSDLKLIFLEKRIAMVTCLVEKYIEGRITCDPYQVNTYTPIPFLFLKSKFLNGNLEPGKWFVDFFNRFAHKSLTFQLHSEHILV